MSDEDPSSSSTQSKSDSNASPRQLAIVPESALSARVSGQSEDATATESVLPLTSNTHTHARMNHSVSHRMAVYPTALPIPHMHKQHNVYVSSIHKTHMQDTSRLICTDQLRIFPTYSPTPYCEITDPLPPASSLQCGGTCPRSLTPSLLSSPLLSTDRKSVV